MTEKIWMWVAWRLPRALVKWCAIRLGAHATQGQYGSQEVPALLFMDALKRWDAEPVEHPDDSYHPKPSYWAGSGRAGNGSDM